MANPNQSEKSNALDREENITKGNLSAKRVALYTHESGSDELQPINADNPLPISGGASSGGNVLADYGIQAISEDATYKYFFFEDSSSNWYVLRKHLANATFDYAKGTGGYASVYVNSTSGPSGSPTYGSKGTIF